MPGAAWMTDGPFAGFCVHTNNQSVGFPGGAMRPPMGHEEGRLKSHETRGTMHLIAREFRHICIFRLFHNCGEGVINNIKKYTNTSLHNKRSRKICKNYCYESNMINPVSLSTRGKGEAAGSM